MAIERQNIIVEYEAKTARFKAAMDSAAASSDKLDKSIGKSKDEVAKLDTQTSKTGKSLGGFSKALKGVALLAVAAVASQATKQFYNLAVGLEAVEKKAKIVFGEVFPQVEQAAKDNAASLGLTNAEYIKAAANIGDLLIPMGFQREEAGQISTQLVNLSGALSEWSGGQLKATEVSEVLNKALLGEREQLKTLGISISENDVQQRLAEKGLKGLTGATLQQAKAAATLELITEKSTDAQESFKNNNESLARTSAELSAKFGTIRDTIATALIPVFARLLKAASPIVAFFADAIPKGIQFVTTLLRPLFTSFSTLFSTISSGTSSLGILQGALNVIGGILKVIVPILTAAVDEWNDFFKNTEFGARVLDAFKKTIQQISFVFANLPQILAGSAAAIKQTGTNIVAFFTRVGLQTKAFFADIEGVFSESARRRAEQLKAQAQSIKESGKSIGEAFREGYEQAQPAVPKTEDIKPEVGKDYKALGEFAGKQFDAGLSGEQKKAADKAAKERKKALEQQLKDEIAAAKEIEKLKIEIIEDATEKKIAEIRFQAATEIEELKGSAEQIALQRVLIEQRASRDIIAIRKETAERLLEIEKQLLAASKQFIIDDNKQREEEILQAAARERQLKLRAIEERILAEKVAERDGLQTREDAETKIQLLQIEALKEQLNNIDVNADERIKLKQQLVDAEISLEESLTKKAKEEQDARVRLIKDASEKIKTFVFDVLATQIAQTDKAIELQQKRVDAAKNIAEGGNAEQLQLEEERLDKLNKEREKFARRQRAIAAIEIATAQALSIAQTIKAITSSASNPVQLALTIAGLVAGTASAVLAIRNSFAGIDSFAKGAEALTGKEGMPGASKGVVIEAHRGERIVPAAQNKELQKLGVTNANIVDIARRGIAISDMNAVIPGMPKLNNSISKQSQSNFNTKELVNELRGVNKRLDALEINFGVSNEGLFATIQKYATRMERVEKLRR